MSHKTPSRPDYEVELKFPVQDAAAVVDRLNRLRAREVGLQMENDVYFASPCRDFAATDEALRLRRTRERLWLTYKGPRVDPASKTREEIDVELKSPAAFEQACALLEHLGYRILAALHKERLVYELTWRRYPVKICLDNVSRLGLFVELETHADAAKMTAARQALEQLAQELGLQHSERRSYLELYLEQLRHLPPDDLLPPQG